MFSETSIPALFLVPYMPSMDITSSIFTIFSLKSRQCVSSFLSLFLKHRCWLILLVWPSWTRLLSDWNWTHLPPRTRAWFLPLSFISVNGTKVLWEADSWMGGWHSLTPHSHSLPMTWLFYHLRSSPQFSLHVSAIGAWQPGFLLRTRDFLVLPLITFLFLPPPLILYRLNLIFKTNSSFVFWSY